MSALTIVVLGGYGNTGMALLPLLLEHSDARLVVCGRSAARAQEAAETYNRRFGGQRVRGQAADAANADSLRWAFDGADLVVAASSTSEFTATVAQVAIECGLDYLDPQFSRAKLGILRSIEPEIRAAGRCFVTDAGFHPGLPAALIRFAAAHFEELVKARVGSVIQMDWSDIQVSESTVDELVTEFRDYQSLSFRDGRWRPMAWLDSFRPEWFTFGHGFGRRYTMPMFLEELRPLPDLIPGLKTTGFYVGGFNWFVDWVAMPVGMALAWVSPRRGPKTFGRMMLWGLKRFSRPPYGTVLHLEAEGMRGGHSASMRVSVSHADGYVLTAAPMAACLLQMLDGSRCQPGLHLQALFVDPARMLADLQKMGVEVKVEGPVP